MSLVITTLLCRKTLNPLFESFWLPSFWLHLCPASGYQVSDESICCRGPGLSNEAEGPSAGLLTPPPQVDPRAVYHIHIFPRTSLQKFFLSIPPFTTTFCLPCLLPGSCFPLDHPPRQRHHLVSFLCLY